MRNKMMRITGIALVEIIFVQAQPSRSRPSCRGRVRVSNQCNASTVSRKPGISGNKLALEGFASQDGWMIR